MIFKTAFRVLLAGVFMVAAVSEGQGQSVESTVQIIAVEAYGEGATASRAIANALVEALQRIDGVKIDAINSMKNELEEEVSSRGSRSESHFSFSTEFKQKVGTRTQGTIHSYEVLDGPTQSSMELWEVQIRANVSKYKTPGLDPHNRRKMAILPFRTAISDAQFGDLRISGSELARLLCEKINNRFTQTRRFSVMDRAYMDEYLSEKRLIFSGDTPVAELSKLNQVLGVDYMVVGTLSSADASKQLYEIQALGEQGYRYSASLTFDYRIVVMATRQVKWADSISLFLSNAQIKSMASSMQMDAIVDALLDAGAKLVVNKALANIYPITIIDVMSDGTLIVNQGGNSLEKGEFYQIFQKGNELKDPYTGEPLGFAEESVGYAQVQRVEAKVSYLRMIEEAPTLAYKNYLCRKAEEHEMPFARQEAPQRQGGVVLPFDR